MSKDQSFPISILIRDGKSQKYIPTGHRCTLAAWDDKLKKVNRTFAFAAVINADIEEQYTTLKLKSIKDRKAKMADILPEAPQKVKTPTIGQFMHSRAAYFVSIKKVEYSNRVKLAANEIEKYIGDVKITQLKDSHIEALHGCLLDDDQGSNNIAHKFKLIKNQLRKYRPALEYNPFEEYKVDKTPVIKIPLTKDEIELYENVRLQPDLDQSRDLFLTSYYIKGLRFKNTCSIKVTDIYNGRITVDRISKSGTKITAPLHPKLKKIVDKYYDENNEYLFPFVDNPRNYNSTCNQNLRIIAAMLGIKKHVHFHMSRHSFANNMKAIGVSINSIKDSLGHGDVRMTETYLKELDDSVLDVDLLKLYE